MRAWEKLNNNANRSPLLFAAMFLFLWAAVGTVQAQVTVQAEVDSKNPFVGDEINYTLIVNSSGRPLDGKPAYPSFAGLTRSGEVMEQTRNSYSSINGRVSTMTTYQFTAPLMAQQAGTIRIEPSTVTVGGQTYQSNALTLTVRELSSAGFSQTLAKEGIMPARAAGDSQLTTYLRDKIFIRPVISNLNPFVRESVIVSYYLYIEKQFHEKRLVQSFRQKTWEPSTTDFLETRTKDASGAGAKLDGVPETLDGVEYYRFPLVETVLLPLKQGQFDLPNFRAQVDIGNRFSPAAVQLGTRSFTLTVKPLPTEGRPADFNGAVGDYGIIASVNKSAVKEFDVVELKIVIEGTGNVATIPEPNLGEIDGIDVFESEGITEKEMKDGKFGGRKIFNIVLQPSKPGDRTIPPISYSFFNPRTEKYQTVQTNPIILGVEEDPDRKQGVVVVQGAGEKNADKERPVATTVRRLANIHDIQGNPDIAFVGVYPIYHSTGFWVMNLTPLGLLGGAFWFGGRRRRLETDTLFARSARAKDKASRRLKGATAALSRQDMEAFYGEVGLALRGLVADRCALPTAGATNEELRDAVYEKTQDRELSDKLYEYLEICDAARYAPVAAPRGDEKWDDINKLAKLLEKKLK